MSVVSKKEADALDRVLDAAGELTELISESGIAIDEDDLYDLSLFLANHSLFVIAILNSKSKK